MYGNSDVHWAVPGKDTIIGKAPAPAARSSPRKRVFPLPYLNREMTAAVPVSQTERRKRRYSRQRWWKQCHDLPFVVSAVLAP